MKSSELLARYLSRGAVVFCTALAMGWLSITYGAAAVEAQQPGAQALPPSRVDIDGEALQISVPPTWRKVANGQTVMFAPENGLGKVAGNAHVSNGIELGVTPTTRRDPNGVFEDLVEAFRSTNPKLRSASITRLVKLAGRLGLRGTFGNTSPVTGRAEFVIIAAAAIERDRALYVIGVAPDDQFGAFRPTFEAALLSLETAR